MTYGTIVRVAAPIQVYEATHAEVMKTADGPLDVAGFILHTARATDDGFEIVEVWESKEQADAFNRDVVWPAMQRSGAPADGPEPEVIEFQPDSVLTGRPFNSDSA
jgi:hypothetical protein